MNPKSMKPIKIFGKEIIEDKVVEQIQNCLTSVEDIAVLTADAHYGYVHPIGVAMAGDTTFDPYKD